MATTEKAQVQGDRMKSIYRLGALVGVSLVSVLINALPVKAEQTANTDDLKLIINEGEVIRCQTKKIPNGTFVFTPDDVSACANLSPEDIEEMRNRSNNSGEIDFNTINREDREYIYQLRPKK